MNVVCRLGEFHMMMSFTASVMSGSGLSDALDLVYGPNAVVQMMTGNTVSWELRGFFMTDAAPNVKLMRLTERDGWCCICGWGVEETQLCDSMR